VCRQELPVIDRVARDYLDDIRFLAVAGNGTALDAGRARARELFAFLDWGLDDSIWLDYHVPYQPYSVLITGDDVILDQWFGAVDEATLRERLDRLAATAGA
jgi:hypothetical protein